MIRFFQIVVSSYYWSKATYHAANEHYGLSLSYLEKSENLRKNNSELLLLKGFLYFVLEKDVLSVETLSKAIKVIQSDKQYNDDTKKYLVHYATAIILQIKETQEAEPQTLININHENVPKFLQDRYPNHKVKVN